MINTYITLDGNKYAISQGTYSRSWIRSFSSQLAANIIRLNFVDRGPGLRKYTMTLQLNTWASNSLPYQAGITKTAEQQMSDLETSYAKVATSMLYLDPFGDPPQINKGVYFTNLNQIIPNYASSEKSYILAEIELTESTQVVA